MPLTFDTLIQHNIRTSRALIAAIVCLMALLCGLISVAISGGAPGILPDMFATGCAVGLALALAGSGVSWFMGGSVIASITGARQIEHGQDPVLINVVEEMAIAAGVPVPAVYLIDDPSPNAFATGRDPQHALIAVTSGLREKLNREELQAVVAHEMAHIKNYDIRLMMLVAVFAGMIVLISDMYLRGLRSSFRGRRGSGNRRTQGAGGGALILVAVLTVAALLLAWLSPLLARLLQLAVSREREFLADATAVQLNRNPQALISALKKIALDPAPLAESSRAVEHLFIINPNPKLRLQRPNLDSAWATHPPLIRRIARLQAIAG